MKRIIRLNESDLTRLVKRIINEQLTQNQRAASFQAGPVSKERADKLAAGGKLTASADNPLFNCIKNYNADDIARVKDVANDEYTKNLKIEYKYEYFPDHMKVTYPYKRDPYMASHTIAYSVIYEFYTDGRLVEYHDGKLTGRELRWNCTGPRNYTIELKGSTPKEISGQRKQIQPVANCAASLSEIKAGSNKILKKGCKNDAVKELQKMLKMDEKHHTGYFGDITKAKVIEFQKNNKDAEGKSLVPDGIVGNKTYEALVKTQTSPNLRGVTSATKQYVPQGLSATLPVKK